MTEETQLYTPEFAIIGSGQRTVDIYRDNLLGLYTEPKHRDLRFDHWKLTELRTYKDKKTGTGKHEYLVATFSDGYDGKVHLRIDRQIQASALKNLIQPAPRRSNPPSDSDNVKQDDAQADDHNRPWITKWARDVVSIHDERKSSGKVPVDHLAFPEDDRINLPQLVLLCCAIREKSTTHHFTQINCYWFCYVTMTAMKALSPRYHSLPVQERQGTWLGMPAGMLSRHVDITELLANLDSMYTKFKNDIDRTINNPNSSHTIEARMLAENEARLRQEAERRAEEEKRRAEEENKRAEEEKRKLEGRAEQERKRAEEEKKRAEEAERRIAELEAKLAAQAKLT